MKTSFVAIAATSVAFATSAFASTSIVCKAKAVANSQTTYAYEMKADVSLENGGTTIVLNQSTVRFNVTGIYPTGESALILNATPQMLGEAGVGGFKYTVKESRYGLSFVYTDLGADSDFAPTIAVTHTIDRNVAPLSGEGSPCEIVRN
jgi:hypothetical protein